MIQKEYIETIGNKKVYTIAIANTSGMKLILCNYGARVIELFTLDKDGFLRDVALGHQCIADCFKDQTIYFGATIGRYANIMSDAGFELGGVRYELTKNVGNKHIHGGINGFDKVVWDFEYDADLNTVIFSYLSPDGEDGYPGTLNVKVKYILTEENEMIIEYTANSDKMTVVTLTNHTYFNLAGHSFQKPEHCVKMYCSRYVPFNDDSIPEGRIERVEETALDFTSYHQLTSRFSQLVENSGYDHYFVADGTGMKKIADVYEKNSGIVMQVISTQPGAMLYANDDLRCVKGKDGNSYDYKGWFCIEPHGFPNAPNISAFPSSVLNSGEKYEHKTVYRFSIQN